MLGWTIPAVWGLKRTASMGVLPRSESALLHGWLVDMLMGQWLEWGMAWGRLLTSGRSWTSQADAASRVLPASRPDNASWAGWGIVAMFRVPRVHVSLLVHLVLGSISIGFGCY